jgi:hypothetical protein
MTSNLDCVGLGVADGDALSTLVQQVWPAMEEKGMAGGATSLRWTDPSGARLSVGVTAEGELADLVPSYAGVPGVRLSGLTLADDHGTATADVVDAEGELCTRLACDLEQWRALVGAAESAAGLATVTALGLDVTVHADEAAFAASDASVMGDPAAPRPDDLDPGSPWPLRQAAESFLPYGLFGDTAHPHAGVAGRVARSETRVVEQTGQTFHAVRLSSLGMELDLCLAATDHPTPPTPGNIVHGTVYLVASLEELWTPPAAEPRRRRWGRR